MVRVTYLNQTPARTTPLRLARVELHPRRPHFPCQLLPNYGGTAAHGEGSAIAIAASISEKAQLQDLFARTKEQLGAVDILVCNAASNPYYGSMDGIEDEQFRKVLDNNILSNHWLIQLALPDMRRPSPGCASAMYHLEPTPSFFW